MAVSGFVIEAIRKIVAGSQPTAAVTGASPATENAGRERGDVPRGRGGLELGSKTAHSWGIRYPTGGPGPGRLASSFAAS